MTNVIDAMFHPVGTIASLHVPALIGSGRASVIVGKVSLIRAFVRTGTKWFVCERCPDNFQVSQSPS